MERFNNIEMKEENGKGEIKRDTDIVTLTISISVPSKNFKTN